MSATAAGLRRQIRGARDLQSVVRTMKTLAASNIGQYERSVSALGDYYRTVELGLSACFQQGPPTARGSAASGPVPVTTGAGTVGAVVFGSDQGLVGRFNDVVADFAIKTLEALPQEAAVWAVGERVHARLSEAGLRVMGRFAVPNSVKAIAPLVGQIHIKTEAHRAEVKYSALLVFHNQPQEGSLYAPVSRRLLPLDDEWRRSLASRLWPTKNPPEILGDRMQTLKVLVHEYLFISLFRACAESAKSENESLLAAMERADKNIDELLEALHGAFNRLRQTAIDAELFDVIAGGEALFGS